MEYVHRSKGLLSQVAVSGLGGVSGMFLTFRLTAFFSSSQIHHKPTQLLDCI